MNKVQKTINLTQTEKLFCVRYESEECEELGVKSKFIQKEMLSMLSSMPGLMECGPYLFQKMKMSHDGQKWVIELEAVGH